MRFLPQAALFAACDEMRAQTARSLPGAVAAHRAAAQVAAQTGLTERQKRLLASALRAAVRSACP